MSVPDNLKDSGVRGPVGTELMGVSVAIPLKETTYDDGTVWDQEDWANAVRHYQPQMLEALRVHVGGARPQTEPQLTVEGPHADPLQGLLYVMTAAAWFFPATLAVDCTAYRARAAEAGERRG